jgi:glycosyltransferase involved in cell wall biosynthesis
MRKMAAGGFLTPLISVIMPLFNAAGTISVALASLQAQTCEDWECIIVNDGSTDRSGVMIKNVCDSRIRYHPLERNRGRGFARQCALEIARGKYITFLDADDWIYPAKIKDQAALLDAEPSLAIVSTGMAISNASDELVGVRNIDVDEPVLRTPMKHPGMPPVAFAPSMLTAGLAKQTGFDPSFPIAEDTDFLLRALLGRRYAVLPAPLYVYRWQGSTKLNKVSSALDCCCRMFEKQLAQYPLHSAVEIAKARAKQMIYYSAATLGMWDYMISRRSRTPNATDYEQYQNAWQIISGIAAGYAPLI